MAIGARYYISQLPRFFSDMATLMLRRFAELALALVDEPAAEPKTSKTKGAAPAKKASKRRPQ